MIIFAADSFVENYVGGAELTTDAIMDSSLIPFGKVFSQQINVEEMEKYKKAFWIFGNFAAVPEECLIYAAKNLNYAILEYDYKYCIYRSPEKHALSDEECNCAKERRGKVISIFLNGAKAVWWMSKKQMEHYQSHFSFLKNDNNRVLSSVFSPATLDFIGSLDTSNKNDKWIILNSPSWIKGVDDAVSYAKKNGLEYELVWGLEYDDLLQKLADSKGVIFFPKAGDTCPRMIIEAKLLGCELLLNDNVQHKDEPWFKTKQSTLEYLRKRTDIFWNRIEDVATNLEIPKVDTKSNIKYKIIVPFYNAGPWIGKCIDSVKRQRHENFECVLIDDMSDDQSLITARTVIDGDPRFRIITNKEKHYALENIAMGIETSNKINDEDVIIVLDGDDWFSSSQSLSRLNEEYADKDCWMTYGSYIFYPWAFRGPEPSAYPKEVIEKNSFRDDIWRASHLRTFKYKLWKNIDHKDLKDDGGKYYTMAYDQALMLPLLEMAGDRSRYIWDLLHVYNKDNPISVDKIKAEQQLATAQEIRRKKPYKRLA